MILHAASIICREWSLPFYLLKTIEFLAATIPHVILFIVSVNLKISMIENKS